MTALFVKFLSFLSRIVLSKILVGTFISILFMLGTYFLCLKANLPLSKEIYPLMLGYFFISGFLLEFKLGQFLITKGVQTLLISGLIYFPLRGHIHWSHFGELTIAIGVTAVFLYEIRSLFSRSSYFGTLKTLREIDSMGNGDTYEKGRQFEEYVAQLYRKLGYKAMTTTEMRKKKLLPDSIQKRGGSGEQGVDVVVYDHINKEKVIVQCKHYSSKVSNSAIQEIVAAMPIYKADRGIVITNQFFTEPAKELAFANNIFLIDRKKLVQFIDSVHNSKVSEDSINEIKEAA